MKVRIKKNAPDLYEEICANPKRPEHFFRPYHEVLQKYAGKELYVTFLAFESMFCIYPAEDQYISPNGAFVIGNLIDERYYDISDSSFKQELVKAHNLFLSGALSYAKYREEIKHYLPEGELLEKEEWIAKYGLRVRSCAFREENTYSAFVFCRVDGSIPHQGEIQNYCRYGENCVSTVCKNYRPPACLEEEVHENERN